MSLARRGSAGMVAALAFVLATMTSGCFLPLGTGAPQSARTVGHGELGLSIHGEAPTIQLEPETATTATSQPVAVASGASMDLGLAYGITDNLDLELDVIGAMYSYFLPMPLGVAGGMRARVVETESAEMAVATRIGYLGEGEDDHADATFLATAVVVQFPLT